MPDPTSPAAAERLVAWLPESAGAVTAAGGKGASLGRMIAAGLPVPQGFVVCAASFQAFLKTWGGRESILSLIADLDISQPAPLAQASESLQQSIRQRELPPAVAEAIAGALGELGKGALVAVRSSAVSEDGQTASFAGQQETFLNVRGVDEVTRRVRDCWASLFSPRDLFYRAQKGALQDVRMAVVVQQMIAAEKSGVLFTLDPVQGRRDRMVIEAVRGCGDAIVSGEVTPEHYVVNRSGGSVAREVLLPGSTGRILGPSELGELWRMGLRLEEFFGSPQDVEWCIRDGQLFLLQSRPITTL